MKKILSLAMFLLTANAGIAQIRKYVYDPSTQYAWLQEHTRLVAIDREEQAHGKNAGFIILPTDIATSHFYVIVRVIGP